MNFKDILMNLPEVAGPTQKRLSFKEKLKWTGIILLLFFILGMIPLFGLGENALAQFEFLSMILGASFGSLMSLGIGPIVTASIVLQLLNGSGIFKFDLTTTEGKKTFQGVQKIMSIFFIVFEGAIYVLLGGLAPAQAFAGTSVYFSLQLILIFQLILGGMLILFMDEIVSKWGFGSGISLFILAGVSKQIVIRLFSWLPGPGGTTEFTYASGAIPKLFQSLSASDPATATIAISGIIATIVVFGVAVYIQAMKVEIPLSFGRIRGHGIRWPLSFTYANVIPVILISALLANMQLWARLLEKWGHPLLGTVSATGAKEGFIAWTQAPRLVETIVQQGTVLIGMKPYLQAIVYMLLMMSGCMLFSYFWVQTSGMDAKSQAKQMMASGLQIPGFRRDERILERLLNRYIGPLTIMGGAAIGFLAGLADVTGSFGGGTGLMLAVMIVYRLYEEIAQQHMMDMHPALRKMME